MRSRSSPPVTPPRHGLLVLVFALVCLLPPVSRCLHQGPARQPLPPPGALLAPCRSDPSPAAAAAGINEGGATKGTPLEGDHSVGYLGTMLEWEEEYRQPFRSMLAHPRVVPVLVRQTPCPRPP